MRRYLNKQSPIEKADATVDVMKKHADRNNEYNDNKNSGRRSRCHRRCDEEKRNNTRNRHNIN